MCAKSKVNGKLPMFPTPNIEQAKPIWTKDLTDKVSPNCNMSKINMAESKRVRERTNEANSRCKESMASRTKPSCPKDLRSNEDSTMHTSSAEGEGSSSAHEKSEKGNPKQAEDLKDTGNAKCEKSKINRTEPECEDDFVSVGKPRPTISSTNTEELDQVIPKKSNERPTHARLCKSIRKPS